MPDPDFEWQGPPQPLEAPRPIPAKIRAMQAFVADTQRDPGARRRVAEAIDKLGFPVGEPLINDPRWHHTPSPYADGRPPQPLEEGLEELTKDKPGDRTLPSFYEPRNEGHYRPVPRDPPPTPNPHMARPMPPGLSLPADPLAPLVGMAQELRRPTVFYEPARQDEETDQGYAQRSDDAYAGAIDQARARDQTVQRYRDIDTGTLGGVAQKTALGGLPYLGVAAQNASRMQAFGVPDRLAGTLMPEGHQSLQTLSNEGVELPGFDLWNFATNVRGAMRGGTPTAALAGKVAKATGATRPAAKLASQAVGGAVGGAVLPAIEEGVDASANLMQGRPASGVEINTRTQNGKTLYEVSHNGQPVAAFDTPEEADAARDKIVRDEVMLPVAVGAGAGALGGAGAHLLQKGAKADMQARRTAQHDLVPAEAGGVYPSGQPANFMRGFALPPRIEAAERLSTRQPVTQPRTPGANLDEVTGTQLMGAPAEDITARAAARRGARGLQKLRTTTRENIGRERDAYYPTPEGQKRYTADQQDGPLEAIRGIIRSATSDNPGNPKAPRRPLPLATVELYQRYAGMFRNGEIVDPRKVKKNAPPPGLNVSIEEARAMGVPIDEMELDRMTAAETGRMLIDPLGPPRRGKVGGVPITRHDRYKGKQKSMPVSRLRRRGATLPEDRLHGQKKKELESILRVRLSPRDFNAQELEETIKNFRDEVSGIAANQRSADVEKKIVGALVDMRKNFKANKGEAEDWATKRARHGREVDEMEDAFRTVALPIKIDDVDPDTKQVFGAVLNTLRKAREEGSDGASLQKLLNRLAQHEPSLQQAVDRLAAHRAYKRLRNEDGEIVRGTASSKGLRAYGVVGDAARAVTRRTLDPLEAKITGSPRPDPIYPQARKAKNRRPPAPPPPLPKDASRMQHVKQQVGHALKNRGQVSPELDTRQGRGLGAMRGGRIGNLAAHEVEPDHVAVFAQWLAGMLDGGEKPKPKEGTK